MHYKDQCRETCYCLGTCYCLDEKLGDPICNCGNPVYACVCQLLEDEIEGSSEYWNNQVKTILVPVQITYHPPTDVLVGFQLLSTAEIEQAIRTDRERSHKLLEIKAKVAAAISCFEDGNAPVALQEVAEVLAAL
jgi:hypothetical protein